MGVRERLKAMLRHLPAAALALGAAVALAARGGNWDIARARFWEARGRPLQALPLYERFVERHAQDPRAAEALVRAGFIYAGQLKRCLEARRRFEAAARAFPELKPWAARAKAGIFNCPDYFPLDSGRTWVYGDSASEGRAMRLEWQMRKATGDEGTLTSALYAGKKRLRADEGRFTKSDWTVWELNGRERIPLLRFPFNPGQSWTGTRDGKKVSWRIEEASARVTVKAGTFAGCLKVREATEGFAATWKYDYYCPFVGRVLTSVAGPGYENRNTELLFYR